jgi:ABC-type lipoprotein export system ATPase subunit
MLSRLRLEGVVKRRVGGERGFEIAVDRLELEAGTVRALAGPSGCGKSTLIDMAGLALRPEAARRFTLELDGGPPVDLARLWSEGRLDTLAALRARHFGYVPQQGALLPFLSVRANIALPQALAGRIDAARVEHLARRLGIAELLDERPERISVGQRQRVAVARALAHAPAFVLADEPTGALDPENAQTVLRLLLELVEAEAIGVLLVSHDHALIERLGIRRLPLDARPGPRGWASRVGGEAARS